MAQSKPMKKLSKKQKEVIQKMREGWEMVSKNGSYADYLTDGSVHQLVRCRRKLMDLEILGSNYKLTELGKSITL